MDTPRRRTGRRPGDHDAREAILDAARRSFGERGFAGATIRAIADAAGVDPALVMHYFGSKADLFAAAVSLPVTPSRSFDQLSHVDREHLGEAILRLVLGIWDDPDALAAWLGLIRSSTTSDAAAGLLREFLGEVVFEQIGLLLDAPDAEYRMALAASQIVGLGVARHVIALEPLASATTDELVAAVAPTLQRYLTADLDP